MASVEYLGMAATALVIASFLFKNIKTLRAVNALGAILWIVYGIIAKAPSVMLLNAVVLGIQAWHISLLALQKDTEDVLGNTNR